MTAAYIIALTFCIIILYTNQIIIMLLIEKTLKDNVVYHTCTKSIFIHTLKLNEMYVDNNDYKHKASISSISISKWC